MSNWFFRIAVVYFVIGVSFGIYMGASGDHSLHPLHAHINLLGWVCMALFGFWYRAFPQSTTSRLAKVHFGLYIPAHLLQMVLLFVLLRGNGAIEPILGMSSIAVGISILSFAVLVWQNTGSAQQA